VTRAPLKSFNAWLACGWLLLIAIAVGSLMPMPHAAIDIPQGDKVQHLLGYGALGFWFAQLYPGTRDRWLCLALLCAFGVSIEIAQGTLTAYRAADFNDVLANTGGLILGIGLAHLWNPLRQIDALRQKS